MRTFLIAMPIVTVMLSFDLVTSLYWFLPLLLLVSLFSLSVSSCVHQASMARNQQQGRWPTAVAQWQDIYNQAGWTLEYHESARGCCGSADALVRFIPMRPMLAASLV
jgi:hypothetical protein